MSKDAFDTGGQGVVLRPGMQLAWGDNHEFAAPVVRFFHDDHGFLQIVTTCAVPLGCEVFAEAEDGAFVRVGQTTEQVYRHEAYRQVKVDPNVRCEDPYVEEPFHARTPRIASPLRTFLHEVSASIGFLAATDIAVEVSMPGSDGRDSARTFTASILRFYETDNAGQHAIILGQHLIDEALRTAGIAVAINEEEGYAVLAPPIDMTESTFEYEDAAHVAAYAVSGASFEDPETGLLFSDGTSVAAEPTEEDIALTMQNAMARKAEDDRREAAA
ncbi:hypothetical protein [Pseudaestuariivita atlantica]|uniref:Uncharacterized protein n=1 Tax=Pseudaestuariivita atlantica TaxID=1317121 RepID=A0A0L1JT37_9RHOB|nr:hypothetical protein [Pseudaestuariivita atlantica]KNG94563.1 hypothetical protein ATO11_03905 [Pseudaestuariivita atlantica]